MTTHIEWTRSDDGTAGMTWNPTTGCDRVSDGCTNCYAMTMAKRLKGMGLVKYQRDGDPRTSGPGFGLTLHPDALILPLTWRKPRRVFVNSMSDLFHKDVPDEFIARVWAVMAVTPQHTYQVLTKRHGRMRSLLSSEAFADAVIDAVADHPELDRRREMDLWPLCEWDGGLPLPNVWGGVSVEDQRTADLRIPSLVDSPLAVRFLRCEPLLQPVDLSQWTDDHGPWSYTEFGVLCRCGAAMLDEVRCKGSRIDWMIAGGESGPGARPCDPEWIRSLVEQCQDARVVPFVKQLGTVWARQNGADSKGGNPNYWPEDLRVRQFPNHCRPQSGPVAVTP